MPRGAVRGTVKPPGDRKLSLMVCMVPAMLLPANLALSAIRLSVSNLSIFCFSLSWSVVRKSKRKSLKSGFTRFILVLPCAAIESGRELFDLSDSLLNDSRVKSPENVLDLGSGDPRSILT